MLRHTSEQPQDIVFEAEEDLYQSPTKQILMLKGVSKSVPLTKNRMFQSYVNEFCGMLGLASNTLRLTVEKRELNPNKIVNTACVIKVQHTPEFHNSPNNSLKPALRSILDQGYCADIKLVFKNNQVIEANKCILTSRSLKFRELISKDTQSLRLPYKNVKTFQKLLVWIYSGELDVPEDVIETIELFYLAQEFQVMDLMWRCEEDIILKISPQNVVDVLVKYYPRLSKDVNDDELSSANQSDEEGQSQNLQNQQFQQNQQLPTVVNNQPDLQQLMSDEESKLQENQMESGQTSIQAQDLNLNSQQQQNIDMLQQQQQNITNSPRLTNHYKAELSQNILNACKSLFIKEFPEVVTHNPNVEQSLASVPGLIISLFSHINEQKHRKKKNKVRFSFVEEIQTPISFDHQFGDNYITDTHSESSSRI
eukprot:403362092